METFAGEGWGWEVDDRSTRTKIRKPTFTTHTHTHLTPSFSFTVKTMGSPLFQLHDCTLDLLAVVVGFLDARDRSCFALAHSYHLLILHTVQHCGIASTSITMTTPTVSKPPSSSSSSSSSGPSSFGLGGLDRPRFLYPGERGGETVALVSYPRSGNSMLRGLLEGVTGVVTGSDTRPDRVLSRSLLKKGLRGEGVVDERAWVVKTHWPERYGYRRFPTQRVILLVRNPFDAIHSYFNMGLTNTHEGRLVDELYSSLGELWEDMARNEAKIWAKFNTHWLTRGLPVLVLRYEDLLLHTEEMLVRLVSFLEKTPPEAVRASALYMARIRKSAAAVKKPPSSSSLPLPVATRPSSSTTNTDGKPSAAGSCDSTSSSSSSSNESNSSTTTTPSPQPCSNDSHDNHKPPSDNRSSSSSSSSLNSGGNKRIGASLRYFSSTLVAEVTQLGGGSLRAFGYDPSSQGFPHQVLSLPPYERCVKFVDPSLLSHATAAMEGGALPPPPPAAATPATATPAAEKVVTVNKGMQCEVRERGDRFGRGITAVRHELTDHDRCPLPTVAR